MELFKVHKGSWSYPEEAYTKFFGVPLYSGFMYASVASYMCQAWHWFNLKIDKQPNQFLSILIAASILQARGYRNFTEVAGGFSAISKTNLPTTDFVCQSKLM